MKLGTKILIGAAAAAAVVYFWRRNSGSTGSDSASELAGMPTAPTAGHYQVRVKSPMERVFGGIGL